MTLTTSDHAALYNAAKDQYLSLVQANAQGIAEDAFNRGDTTAAELRATARQTLDQSWWDFASLPAVMIPGLSNSSPNLGGVNASGVVRDYQIAYAHFFLDVLTGAQPIFTALLAA